MTKILYFILFISTFSVHAQRTLISGKIIVDDADEVINLNGFLIENLATNSRVKANTEGLFSLNVSEGDVLFFKQNGITERHLKISKSMINKGFIEVHVNVEVIELDETKVSKLNKDLLKDVGKKKTISKEVLDTTGINDEAFKKAVVDKHNWAAFHRKANPYAGNLLEAVKLFKTSNEKGTMLKKRVSAYEQVQNLKSIIGETFFIIDLNISRENIVDFIGSCYEANNIDKLMRKKNFSKIKLILKEQAPMYLNKIKEKENE